MSGTPRVPRRKADIDFHYDYGRAHPAVGIRVETYWPDAVRSIDKANFEHCGPDDPFWAWCDERFEDDDSHDSTLQLAWQCASEEGFELLVEDAREWVGWPVGQVVKIYTAGRMGGWAEVHGLSDPETWDAIEFGRWRRFCKVAVDLCAYNSERWAWHLYVNFYEPMVLEPARKLEQELAEAALPVLLGV